MQSKNYTLLLLNLQSILLSSTCRLLISYVDKTLRTGWMNGDSVLWNTNAIAHVYTLVTSTN